MSKINDLIKELCPSGVEYKKLKDISNMERGQSITSKDLLPGDIPVIAGGQLPFSYNNKHNRDGETITVSSSGAYAGFLNYWNQPILCTDSFTIKSELINMRFLFHYLKMKQNEIYNKKKGAGIPHVHISDMENMKVPVPPLEIQEEIVRILDKFGKLEAELEVELKARKRQYEFWREKLLNKEGKTKILDVFRRVKGTPITASKMKEIEDPTGNIRIFAGGQTAVNANIEDIPKANIIDFPCVIVQSRGLIDFIYYDKPCTFKNEMWAYTCDNQITVKYLYHFLKNNVNYFRTIGTQMGSMPQISLSVTEKFELYLPSLEEQGHIVNILDKFDKLINDITVGFPAEIELRRKQYEYYRNKLLSFEVMHEESDRY